jgi:endonuclease YncB( thermonuclease family)
MRADPVVTTMAAVTALVVIDGDTLHVGAERYRLLGIDAAEIHRVECDAERRLGQLTKRRLETLLGSGPLELRPGNQPKRDKYGRLLIHLLVNGEDAACVLLREGYARPWRGRREDWCVKIDRSAPVVAGYDCAGTVSPTLARP